MSKLYLLVANPTQMMNAIEARHFYDSVFHDFELLIFSESLSYQKQILSMADDSWNKKIYVPKGSGKWNALVSIFAKRNFFREVFNSAKKGDALMIGNIHHFGCCSLASRWKDCGEVYAMDDGLGTVNWDNLLSNQQIWTPKIPKGWKGKIEKLIWGIPRIQLNCLKFFSVYPLTHFPNAVLNNFELISKKYMGKAYNMKLVYFLEQPLVELGVLHPRDYDKMIRLIQHHYQSQGCEFTIVRHRAAHFQNSSDGLEYVSWDKPVEWVMTDWDVIPGTIATFYSSGAYHLNKMSLGQIKAEYWQIKNDLGDVIVQPQLMQWLRLNSLSQMTVLEVAI